MQKNQVRRFYEEIWNANDISVIPEVLHENFTFRGSLGHEIRGYEGFIAYVDMVHKGLSDYRCIIDELVTEGDKVCAKMNFSGFHQDEFMGYMPSGKRLNWAACAFFTFERQRISDLWVLGDLQSLELQLERNTNAR